jgi:hypothetical protein
MRFEGESDTPAGAKLVRRLAFFNLSPDRVRRYSELSSDAGKSWTVDYDLTYIRKHLATFDILPAPDQIRNLNVCVSESGSKSISQLSQFGLNSSMKTLDLRSLTPKHVKIPVFRSYKNRALSNDW